MKKFIAKIIAKAIAKGRKRIFTPYPIPERIETYREIPFVQTADKTPDNINGITDIIKDSKRKMKTKLLSFSPKALIADTKSSFSCKWFVTVIIRTTV